MILGDVVDTGADKGLFDRMGVYAKHVGDILTALGGGTDVCPEHRKLSQGLGFCQRKRLIKTIFYSCKHR